MPRVVIGLGTNVGDRVRMLQASADMVRRLLANVLFSSIYETEPMYVTDQPKFLNAVAIGDARMGPWELLTALKAAEQSLGRIDRERYGPREIDLDLIAFGSVQYIRSHDGVVMLHIPHPRVGERRFVLDPLHEIVPDLVLPSLGPVSSLLATQEVRAQTPPRRIDADFSVPCARC